MDLHPGRNIYLTSWFVLSVLFWQVVRCLWSLHVSWITHHIDLYPGRNVYLTSWFVLSVLFFTGGETSVVLKCIRDPPSNGSPPQKEHLPDQLVHSVCIIIDRW